tara:strand:- start:1110 stop:1331 length:222 start_codon:yes stop_codon:yes gene_type:complete
MPARDLIRDKDKLRFRQIDIVTDDIKMLQDEVKDLKEEIKKINILIEGYVRPVSDFPVSDFTANVSEGYWWWS